MFCGSIKDFDILLSKFNFLEKKLKSLQKHLKNLVELIANNQEEIRTLLEKEGKVGLKDKEYCSIRL